MATPIAQEAYEEFFATLGGKPVHHTLATHWARLIELLYAAERMGELAADPEIVEPRRARRSRRRRPTEGIGVVEAPRGTLFHHYETDERGLITQANLIVATQNNAARIALSVDKAAQGAHARARGRRRPAERGRDGLPRLRPVLRVRDARPAGRDAADRRDPPDLDGELVREIRRD